MRDHHMKKLRSAAEQFLASCADGDVDLLIDYYRDIFAEALGMPAPLYGGNGMRNGAEKLDGNAMESTACEPPSGMETPTRD